MQRNKVSIVLAVIGVACAACGPAQGPPPGAQGQPPTPVKLIVAGTKPIEDATEFVATLKSLHSTTVQPQIDGQITQVYVKSGDRVAQGAPLAQIDSRRQQAAVSSQEAERASKEANVTFARQQHQRASGLYAAGAISKQELEQAETTLRTAEADLKSLQAQVQQQEVQLRYFTVAAPTSGIVGDVPVRIGNQVTSQTVLTTIDQNETLEVNLSVPIERAASLRNGLAVQLLSGDSQQQLAATTVSFVSPRVDDQTQTVLVKGIVRNATGALRASQFVRARVVWKTADGLTIPITAVSRVNGQFFAFIAEESKPEAGAKPGAAAAAGTAGAGGAGGLIARQRAIKVGPIIGDDYAVLSGLVPGDRVVVSGVQKLADGAPIAATS